MQSFEFLMILISIVIGLGVAELLGMLARMLRGEARGGTLHALWVIAILLTLIQVFWSEWELQYRSDWSLIQLLVFLMPPLLLFLAASLLCPRIAESTHLDTFFLERHRPFFFVLMAFLVSASIEAWVLLGRPGASDVVRAGLFIMCITLALNSNRRLHLWGALIWIGTLIGFAVSFTFSLAGMGP